MDIESGDTALRLDPPPPEPASPFSPENAKANVRTELFLLALAFDLKKLWMKRESGRLQTHLSQLNSA